MDTPTRIIQRGAPGYENVEWERCEMWATDARTGRTLSLDEALDPACDFTQIVYCVTHYADRPPERLKLYHFYRPESQTP